MYASKYIYDQLAKVSSMGLTAAALTDCRLEDIESGKYQLTFASAEQVLSKPFLSLLKKNSLTVPSEYVCNNRGRVAYCGDLDRSKVCSRLDYCYHTELFIFFTARERVADHCGCSLTYCTLIIISIWIF